MANDTPVDPLQSHIKQILPRIQRAPAGGIQRPWLSVSFGEHYSNTIFTWDHHHAALRLAYEGKPEFLRYLPENLIYYQRSDGYTPSMVSIEQGPRNLNPVYHAQPFLFQGVLAYWRVTGDQRWLQEYYPRLRKYLDFFFIENRAPLNLLRYRVGWYGGIDNDVTHTFFAPESTIPCDLPSLVYRECLAAAEISNVLGLESDKAHWRLHADTLAKAVNDFMWIEDEETYGAYNLIEGSPMLRLGGLGLSGEVGRYAFASSTNLMPLHAGIAPPERAEKMIRRYLLAPEHFASPHGVRSLSARSEYYNNARWGNPTRFGDPRRMTNSNWQGPVWFPTCYFMAQALSRYGYKNEALDLAKRIYQTLSSSVVASGSMAENFHGETGQPLYARDFASWNVLADTLESSIESGRWLDAP